MSRALLKICGRFLQNGSALQKLVDVSLELDFNVILVYGDFFDDQLQIHLVQLVLGQDLVENVQRRTGDAVDLDDRVALVGGQLNLVLEAADLGLQLGLQLVIGLFQQFLFLRVLHHVPHPLALGGL